MENRFASNSLITMHKSHHSEYATQLTLSNSSEHWLRVHREFFFLFSYAVFVVNLEFKRYDFCWIYRFQWTQVGPDSVQEAFLTGQRLCHQKKWFCLLPPSHCRCPCPIAVLSVQVLTMASITFLMNTGDQWGVE